MTNHVDYSVMAPRFGRAGAGSLTEWGDADNFDVEILAEFLLGDDKPGSGMTFDFKMDTKSHGSLVSPENSEDGIMPPLGDVVAAPAPPPPVAAPVSFTGFLPNPLANIQPTPVATPAPTPTPVTTPIAPAKPVLQPFPPPAVANNNTKRRCVEGPGGAILAVAGGTSSSVFGLAAAAAQAMQQQPPIAAAVAPPRGRKKKSQAQIDRRRERNRILARRTRLRKKFFFESLQKEILDLQRENTNLKAIVRENLDASISQRLLAECDALEKMPPSVLEACAEGFGEMDSQDFNLVSSIQKSQHAFLISDPSLEDNPIVFASDDFLKLTGYDRSQVLGRNCRFLQGPATSKQKLEEMRTNLSQGQDVSVTLVNYRQDGTPFWNKLFVAALRDAQQNIVNYIGVAVPVASPAPGDPEHGVPLPTVEESS